MSFQININNPAHNTAADPHSVYRVLIQGQISDGLTQKPLRGSFTISLGPASLPLQSLLFIKMLENGLFCIAGVVERVFPHLATNTTAITLKIDVPGYEDVPPLSVTINPNSTFPLEAIQVQVLPLPVRMRGRVTNIKTVVKPLANALVRFMDEPNPATPLTEHFVALRVPLHLSHANATIVQQREKQTVGTPKQLTVVAPGGSQSLVLSDQNNLAINDILLVGTEAAGEYVVIDSLAQDGSGRVLLRYKLNHSFAIGTNVQKYTLTALGSKSELTRVARAGDGVLFLKDLLQAETGSGVWFVPNELSGVETLIEIADANAAQVEYHDLGALTDGDGYYRFEGINRVPIAYMGVSIGDEINGFTLLGEPLAWTIDYRQPINSVDFRFIL